MSDNLPVPPKGNPLHVSRRGNAKHKFWKPSDKIKAVAAYLVLGNMARVEDQTGIPLGTLNYWKTLPWWYEQMERIRQEQDIEVDNNFTRIVKKTQDTILDRLDNGDIVLTKDGDVMRKPIGARDAAIINAIAIDKRKIIRDTPNAQLGKVGMTERLKNLETQFTKLVKDRTIKVIDVEVIKDDNSEVREGIQSGVREDWEEPREVEELIGSEEEISSSGVVQNA